VHVSGDAPCAVLQSARAHRRPRPPRHPTYRAKQGGLRQTLCLSLAHTLSMSLSLSRTLSLTYTLSHTHSPLQVECLELSKEDFDKYVKPWFPDLYQTVPNPSPLNPIDNLLVRIHCIIVMTRWTGLAPWEFAFPFPGSLTCTFLSDRRLRARAASVRRHPRSQEGAYIYTYIYRYICI